MKKTPHRAMMGYYSYTGRGKNVNGARHGNDIGTEKEMRVERTELTKGHLQWVSEQWKVVKIRQLSGR